MGHPSGTRGLAMFPSAEAQGLICFALRGRWSRVLNQELLRAAVGRIQIHFAKLITQRLKPVFERLWAARLKPCPDTNHLLKPVPIMPKFQTISSY